MNETTTKSGRLPKRRRMWSERVLKMVRVTRTSKEMKEKVYKTRTNVKRLLHVITSKLAPPPPPFWNLGSFNRLIKPTMHNLISK